MAAYVPHPSTIAYRAIEHLKTLPAGKEVACKPLADAIETDTSTLLACMVTACKHGLVLREKKNGLVYFSLGDGVSLAVARDEPEPKAEKPEVKPRAGGPLSSQVTDKTLWGDSAPKPDKACVQLQPAAEREALDMGRVHRKRAQAPASAPDPVPTPEPAPVASVQPDPVPATHLALPFAFSWSSDGYITVSKDGESVTMAPEDYQKLKQFIDAVRHLRLEP